MVVGVFLTPRVGDAIAVCSNPSAYGVFSSVHTGRRPAFVALSQQKRSENIRPLNPILLFFISDMDAPVIGLRNPWGTTLPGGGV